LNRRAREHRLFAAVRELISALICPLVAPFYAKKNEQKKNVDGNRYAETAHNAELISLSARSRHKMHALSFIVS
jgi:hypothetical protein